MINACFVRACIDVEAIEESIRPVLYTKDRVKVLLKEVLLAHNEDARFCRLHNA